MMFVATGFLVVFLLSYWISARVGARRQSPTIGLFAGALSYVLMMLAYLAALAYWVRATLIAFLQTELPLLIERVMEFVDRIAPIRDTL